MKLTKGNIRESGFGIIGSVLKPYYFDNDKFISNLVLQSSHFGNYNQSRSELADKIKNLRKNNYKFIQFYCGAHIAGPIDFVKWVKENNYSLEVHGELLRKHEQYSDFHGNLKQVSCAFMFRIYDQKTIKQLENELRESSKVVFYQT